MAEHTSDSGTLQELKASLVEMGRAIDTLGDRSQSPWKSCPLLAALLWRHPNPREQYWRRNGYWVID